MINAELKIFIKHNVRTEMDRFINKMLKKKFKISVFNNNDYWYDLGNKQKLAALQDLT